MNVTSRDYAKSGRCVLYGFHISSLDGRRLGVYETTVQCMAAGEKNGKKKNYEQFNSRKKLFENRISIAWV